MTPEAILLTMATLLERPGGWRQGRNTVAAWDGVAPLCLEDALAVADGAVCPMGHTLTPDGLAAYQALRAELGNPDGPLWAWQDEAGRSVHEVAALCRNAKRQLAPGKP